MNRRPDTRWGVPSDYNGALLRVIAHRVVDAHRVNERAKRKGTKFDRKLAHAYLCSQVRNLAEALEYDK